MRSKAPDIRQASPREQAKWLRDRGWKPDEWDETCWYYGTKIYPEFIDNAIDAELAAEALRRKRAGRKAK